MHLLANIDSLAGLGTRHALDSTLDVEWRCANRHRTPMAVLTVDVDDSKPCNGRYGHATGNIALHTVTRCINDNIKRSGDSAGRYGDEEFCAVLPNTNFSGVVRAAEVIRAAILAADESDAGSVYSKLTVSIGVAVHSGVAAGDDTLEDLVRLANGRLYEAEAVGRNVVLSRQEWSKLAAV